ncbi:MAG TPA: cation:proton antiporter [Acidimicrobiia bacterium]|nr:cation:proton antiporter [Acidimicrobiia bacterium]
MTIGSLEMSLFVLLVIVVFGPIISERFGIPAIVGLIFGGVLFGPFVIGWLEQGGVVSDLGAIGILYLMFLAGLAFNMRAFLENRNSAIAYGLLGFILPFGLSMVVVLSLSEISVLGAALIGAMWASNTLVAYPDVKAAGLANNRGVSAAVSAGVVADLLSLTVLAFATATAVIDLEPELFDTSGEAIDLVGSVTIQPTNPDPFLSLWIALPLLGVFCFWILPKVTNWFFVNVGRSRMQRFVFALAGMAAGATVASLGGIEGLIGAFLAGLGMNRLVPANGSLMDRLDFVGAAIFVPAFIVSIGLNIDPAVLFDVETLFLGALFTVFVVVGKTAAAVMTGLAFRFSWDEIGIMSSLSFGQAASTLAIAQVGLSLGMFDQLVVNAAVLAIVATALITSFGTRFFIERVPRPASPETVVGENVLVDVRDNGSASEVFLALAAGIARPDNGLVIPYAVTERGGKEIARSMVDRATAAASAHGLDSEGVVRVDDSFTDATINLIEEIGASLVMLSWSGPRFAADYVLGNDIDKVGELSPVPTMAVRVLRPWRRIVVALGDVSADWRKDDARLVLSAVRRLRRTNPVPLVVFTGNPELLVGRVGDEEFVEVVSDSSQRRSLIDRLERDDLLITAAYVLHDLPPMSAWRMARSLQDLNVAVIAGPHRLTVSRTPAPSLLGTSST